MSNSILSSQPRATSTVAQTLQRAASAKAIQQKNAFTQITRVFKDVSTFIWGDLTAGVPQTKFQAFTDAGYRATDLVVNAQAAIALIATLTGVMPDSLVPVGYSLTLNDDGTVTVVEPSES